MWKIIVVIIGSIIAALFVLYFLLLPSERHISGEELRERKLKRLRGRDKMKKTRAMKDA